jgi:hypothetical protein
VEAGGTLYLNQREKTVVSYDGEIGNLRLSNDMGGVSVVRIAAGALAGCDTLTGLVIPENITSMGEYAFKGCENLKSLEISGSMETIPYRAFDRTVSLNLKLPATVTSIGSYAFYQQDAQQKITLESEPVIGHHAFSENAEITYEIPSVKPTEEPTAEPTATAPATQNTKRSVKKGTLIKKKAATYKVVSIGKTRTVSYEKPTNKKAKKQTIPAQISYKGKTYKVVSVKAKAFYKNTKLQKVTIGKNVKKIGKKAFYGCKKLSAIQVKTKQLKRKTVAKNAFKKIASHAKVKVVKGGWFSLK